MKKSVFTLVFLALFSISAFAQKFDSLDKSPMDVAAFPASHRVSDKTVKVIYSRPQLKGRQLETLARVGKVWRTGANEATEIIFYKDVTFGGEPVKAGRYSLFTIPGKKEWTIILNKAENVWGAYFYKQEEDVLRVQSPVSTIQLPIEAFSIGFDGEEDAFQLFLGWGNVVVAVPIVVSEAKKEE